MSLTGVLITVALFAIGYFFGVVRPTGLLSKTQGPSPPFPVYAALGLFGFAVIAFGGYTGFWSRLQIEIDGTVVARQDFPKTPQNHRPKTIYTFQRSDGARSDYTADPGDGPLPQTFPVGAHLVKRKWELGYTLNGQRVDDFPLIGSLILMGFGLGCLGTAAIKLRRGAAKPT